MPPCRKDSDCKYRRTCVQGWGLQYLGDDDDYDDDDDDDDDTDDDNDDDNDDHGNDDHGNDDDDVILQIPATGARRT